MNRNKIITLLTAFAVVAAFTALCINVFLYRQSKAYAWELACDAARPRFRPIDEVRFSPVEHVTFERSLDNPNDLIAKGYVTTTSARVDMLARVSFDPTRKVFYKAVLLH